MKIYGYIILFGMFIIFSHQLYSTGNNDLIFWFIGFSFSLGGFSWIAAGSKNISPKIEQCFFEISYDFILSGIYLIAFLAIQEVFGIRLFSNTMYGWISGLNQILANPFAEKSVGDLLNSLPRIGLMIIFFCGIFPFSAALIHLSDVLNILKCKNSNDASFSGFINKAFSSCKNCDRPTIITKRK